MQAECCSKLKEIIECECLVIVYALRQFCHYLLGRHFALLMDNVPLQWLQARRWKSYVLHITISYRKGTANGNADALSSRKQIYIKEQCVATLCLPQLLYLTSNDIKLMTQLYFVMNYNLEHPHKDVSGMINHCDDTNKFGHSLQTIHTWTTL